MPFLIRIIVQRLLAGMIAVLAFFGLEPNIHVNMEPDGPIIVAEADSNIGDILNERDTENTFDIRDIATTAQELSPAEVATIPLPQRNILEELRRRAEEQVTNITQTESLRSRQPVFAPVPNQSVPSIPQQADPVPQPDAIIDIPVEESIDQSFIEAFEEALQNELDALRIQDESEEVSEDEPEPEVPQLVNDTSETRTIENSVVNIQCVRRTGNQIKLTTGSGVIISTDGVVLTNEHVDQ